MHSWRIGKDGGGIWAGPVQEGAAAHTAETLAVHEIAPRVQNHAALDAILKNLPQPAPDSNGCANFMTDMPYGTIRLSKGATTSEIAWNSGCMDKNYAQFIAVLKQADGLVREWGARGKILRDVPSQ